MLSKKELKKIYDDIYKLIEKEKRNPPKSLFERMIEQSPDFDDIREPDTKNKRTE